MRSVALAAAIAVSASALASVFAAAQSTGVVVAADLGTQLEPIARFDGSTWVAVPLSGLGKTIPLAWTRVYAPGQSVAIRLGTTAPSGRCERPRRLPVASPPPAPRGGFDPVYVGVAVSSAIPHDSLRRITERSPEWKTVTAAISPLFERRAGRQGVASSALARVPMTVDWLVAAASGAAPPTFYFEASKRIPDAGGTPSEDPKGIVRISVTGWLRTVNDRIVPAGTKSELSWETDDRSPVSGGPGLLPLGVLRQGDEAVWVMKSRTGTRDTFTLYGVRGSIARVLLTVDAATC
jgi:hypothetical protein